MLKKKKKLLRLTTVDLSLDKLLCGQLRFLNQYYDVVAVASDTGLLQKVEKREGVKTLNVPMCREISLLKDIKSLVTLIRLMYREHPDILHCNTPKGSLLGLLAGKIVGVPHRVYTVTGLRYQGAHGWLRLLLRLMEMLSCACATHVIPEGQGVMETLQSDHITSHSLRVLHHGNINGVDTQFYSREALMGNDDNEGYRCKLREKMGFQSRDFVFVFIGRIVRDKGIQELATAFQQLPKNGALCPRLLLVGSFEQEDPIDAATKAYLETSAEVRCVGWQDDIRPFLLAADTLVFPSYREGFPNVPIQAGALELASIVSNITGCNEIIKDGLNGTIVAPHSSKALYTAMAWYLSHPEDVKRMAANARPMVIGRYAQEDVWNALKNFYDAL